MTPYRVRRAPWTCEWGRFGIALEELAGGRSRLDDVFWVCHHPEQSPRLRLMERGECERCPFWVAAARLQAEP